MSTADGSFRDRIVELTRQGLSAAQIAENLGCTTRTVVRNRRAAGIARSSAGEPMSADELARARDMLADGAPVNEVARTVGRSWKTIRKHFPGAGWPRGSGSEIRVMNRALARVGGFG